MDNLVRITKNITFSDLKSGRKSPIDVWIKMRRYEALKSLNLTDKSIINPQLTDSSTN